MISKLLQITHSAEKYVLQVRESMSKIQYSSNSTFIILIHLAVIPQLPHGIHPVVTFSCYLEFIYSAFRMLSFHLFNAGVCFSNWNPLKCQEQ